MVLVRSRPHPLVTGSAKLLPMTQKCSGCGWVTAEGKAGCRARFDQLCARDYSQPTSYRYHRMLVDAYCLQHWEEYGPTGKRFAAHLAGLCCAFEHDSHPSVLRALQGWVTRASTLPLPELPANRGAVTIGDIPAEAEDLAYVRAVEGWARAVWEAHASLHPLARQWVQEALARK